MPSNAQEKDVCHVKLYGTIKTFVEWEIDTADGVTQADKNDLPNTRLCLCGLPFLMLGFYLTHPFLGDYFFHAAPNPSCTTCFVVRN